MSLFNYCKVIEVHFSLKVVRMYACTL